MVYVFVICCVSVCLSVYVMWYICVTCCVCGMYLSVSMYLYVGMNTLWHLCREQREIWGVSVLPSCVMGG